MLTFTFTKYIGDITMNRCNVMFALYQITVVYGVTMFAAVQCHQNVCLALINPVTID